MHYKALLATLLLIAGQVTGILLYFSSKKSLSREELLAVCIGTYLIYLIVACCSNPLPAYLRNISRGQTFEKYYEKLRNTAGHFIFHA